MVTENVDKCCIPRARVWHIPIAQVTQSDAETAIRAMLTLDPNEGANLLG